MLVGGHVALPSEGPLAGGERPTYAGDTPWWLRRPPARPGLTGPPGAWPTGSFCPPNPPPTLPDAIVPHPSC